MLDITPNQPSKFQTKNWVKINDESRGTYNKDRSSSCDYSDGYIPVKGTITVANIVAATTAANNVNKKVIFKNYAPFPNCISRVNNTQVDMLMILM